MSSNHDVLSKEARAVIARLVAAVDEAASVFETIAMPPTNPDNGVDYARQNVILAQHGARRMRKLLADLGEQ